MKYFDHQYSESFGRVWELFHELSSLSRGEVSVHNEVGKYTHTNEIINAAMNKIQQNQEGFNIYNFDLSAYLYECKRKDDIKQNENRKKYLTIVDTVNGSDENTVGYGEISVNDSRLKSIDDAFALLEDDDEFEHYLSVLYSIRNEYIISKGVDLVEMLSNSLKGIPEALSLLTELINEDLNLKEIVGNLCLTSKNTLLSRLETSF